MTAAVPDINTATARDSDWHDGAGERATMPGDLARLMMETQVIRGSAKGVNGVL